MGLSLGDGAFHSSCPARRAGRHHQNGTLEEILVGPARENDGTFNLFGGLRTSMATCGHKDLAEFNRAEVVIAPSLQTEGKQSAARPVGGHGLERKGRCPRKCLILPPRRRRPSPRRQPRPTSPLRR